MSIYKCIGFVFQSLINEKFLYDFQTLRCIGIAGFSQRLSHKESVLRPQEICIIFITTRIPP